MKKEEKKIMYVSPEIRTDNVKVEHGFAPRISKRTRQMSPGKWNLKKSEKK